jgi:protein TonB
MNIAPTGQRTWSPSIIALSVLLHALVLYGIAASFQIVPLPVEPSEIEVPIILRSFTPPPPVAEIDPVAVTKPRFEPRPTTTPRETPVEALPLPPVVNAPTTGTPTLEIGQPISEQPTVRFPIRYPLSAENAQIEGRVVLSVTILPDGSVTNVRIIRANPPGVFETSAIQSVSRWKYRPSGVVRTNVIIEIDYVLN